ncbi:MULTISPECIES: SRPBCC family protein [unclassified Yoonia]|uniref:SRPBCC family protein n=1 Tax=unclassified Yoonia TaxID=2629118 RepID=UPI002B00053C|nr:MULTISPECIES: SRPBCC family protein [unclassified Yoonia]
MEIALYIVLGLVALVAVLSALAPVRVEYTEEIIVNAPVADVYDDIRMQEHLMRWSAWPKETKSTCSVEGTDGAVGVKTAFFTKGKRVGHQEVVSLKENEEVALTLIGPGPPHRPKLTFKLHPEGDHQTRVLAHFTNELTRPFNAIWKFAGLSKWTREMHRKDLAGLKAFSEPPHLDMNGTPVGRPPIGVNPYAHAKQTV